jgi:hypothetical protein
LAIIDPDTFEIPEQNRVNISFEDTGEVIHPYLGYVIEPSEQLNRPYYGFPDASINPKSNDTLVIGILGGSFAQETSEQGREALIAELKKFAGFNSQKIVIHTLALGGYKQPQQLFTLLYFLSLEAHFDIIINLDGFNEVALPLLENVSNNVSPFYPRSWLARVGNLNDSEMLAMIGKISLLQQKRVTFANVFAAAPFRYSVVANILWRYFEVTFSNEQISKAAKLQNYKLQNVDDLGYVATGPLFAYDTNSEKYEALANFWKICSIQMHKVSTANNIAYFHFLQPNQYVAGTKIMKEEEMRIAYLENHPYKPGVEAGYPFLIKEGNALQTHGINFHDLTMIFAHNDNLLYKDQCCHLNAEGYNMIGSAIGKIIVENFSVQ